MATRKLIHRHPTSRDLANLTWTTLVGQCVREGEPKIEIFQIDTRGFEFSTSTYSHEKKKGEKRKKNIISFLLKFKSGIRLLQMNIYCLFIIVRLKTGNELKVH